ncbi:MAG: hypothetical protein AAGU11_01615 [Syntrophobacteraceae bacterium]
MTAEAEKYMVNDVACSQPFEGAPGSGSHDEQTKIGLEQYSQAFSKFLVGNNEERKDFSDQEKERRDRARKANKIYKSVCEDMGLKACFFSNFRDWTEYVEGNMSDAEFKLIAAEKARQMMAEEN